MANKIRNTAGKFAPKSEAPRKVRSVNLTDDAWQWLAAVAEAAGVSRNDYLESLAEGNVPFMEMANNEALPFIETVEAKPQVPDLEPAKQKDVPLMETVQSEIEALKQELRSKSRQLEEQDTELLKLHERNGDLGLEVQNLKEELEKERADRDEIQAQLSELKQNSAPAATTSFDKTLPDAAQLLSQLRGKRKKSKVDLGDIETLLGLLKG
ncbi:hypothetical protein MicvaDRAFT_0012 [Microcoleus vaginatus FGP-2]|nr:hypothetical protein MicvaDRAFT_0012 [Microcoleus vaginatus FGP-2]